MMTLKATFLPLSMLSIPIMDGTIYPRLHNSIVNKLLFRYSDHSPIQLITQYDDNYKLDYKNKVFLLLNSSIYLYVREC